MISKEKKLQIFTTKLIHSISIFVFIHYIIQVNNSLKGRELINSLLSKPKPPLLKPHNFLLTLILCLVYTAFIGMQLNRIQAIAVYNYSLSELTMVPITILVYFGPIILLAYFIVTIKLLRSNIKLNFVPKQFAITAFIIISFILITPISIKQFNEVSTTMIATVDDKTIEQNKYFIVTNNEKINVTRNEYNLVNVNQEYMISYRWNKKNNVLSKVTYIEPIVYN